MNTHFATPAPRVTDVLRMHLEPLPRRREKGSGFDESGLAILPKPEEGSAAA